jgi:hypothetical protein
VNCIKAEVADRLTRSGSRRSAHRLGGGGGSGIELFGPPTTSTPRLAALYEGLGLE